MRLQIDLYDGFDHDTIVITADGKEVVRKDDVTTRTQISYAGTIEADLPNHVQDVLFEIRARGISARIPLDPRQTGAELGVSITEKATIDFGPRLPGYL